jgi:pimeloyl-ACP methyl ester carboxylesterase
MHEEAVAVLPEVMAAMDVADPVLFGHSDGASIAIIHAGAVGGVRGLILEAPHVFVEAVTLQGIAEARKQYEATGLRDRLARHHGDRADQVFDAWSGVWLHDDFRGWNIESCLPAVQCPVLVIQGEEDRYGTVRQVDAIVSAVGGPAEKLLLPGCGHAPHREREKEVLAAVERFVTALVRQR